MAQRDKDKARKLIAKLEAHQAAEIRCLRALHGLSSEEDIGVDDKDIDIEEDALSVAANRSAPDSSVQSKDLAESSPDEGPSANSHPLPSQVQCPIPKEWDAEWDNDLLRRRIEERIRDPGCGGDQWKSFPNVDPQDPAAGFINSTALRDLGRFTFKRDLSALEEPGAAGNVLRDDRDSSTAFVVLDFDHNKQLVLDTRRTSPEQQSSSNSKPGEAVGSLFSSRSTTNSYTREIEINAFTPSALAAVLLSSAKDDHHDYSTIYAALRRHLSTSNADRNYCEGHGFTDDLDYESASERHILSFTVTYFALTDGKPAVDAAPLMPSGFFGVSSSDGKYIREEKFSFSWTTCGLTVPALIAAFNPLYSRTYNNESMQRFPVYQWVDNNFRGMWWKWEEVLDALDRQTSFPSTILFDHQTRQSILFEDDNFTNSKRYFWALQSLRLFGEQIEVTLRALPNIFCTLCLLDGNDFSQEEQERVLKSHITEFRAIGERIERKRQEIQGLSDGLFSASSVIEARLAADQNSNIRMLTLVTIAYLPLSFIASIYGMGALPKSANNLASFFIATAVACFITFSIVFNLRNGEKIIFHYLRGRTARLQKKMQKDSDAAWKVRGMQLQEADRNKRIGVPASTWWYLGFLFHRAFGVFTNRRAAEDKQRSGQEV